MGFRITNNPNYEREEQARLEALRQQQMRQNEERRILIDKYLDDVQRIIDSKRYRITPMRLNGLFRENVIKIVLGYSFYSSDRDTMLPVMNELSNIIHSKCPQWQVKGFHHGSKVNDNHNGEFGIFISGDLKGL